MTLLSKPLESFKAIEVIELDQSSIVEWFKVKGLISKSKACPKCQMAMKFIEMQDSLDGFAWRCTTESKRCSLRDGTYLEKFRIDAPVTIPAFDKI
ncbi:transposase HI [Brachionus plicatilis]|uniref:Transposase HI n=1 Tax=Brachionus plicatilis TaxID=10195 RepID=A0A3M7T4F0_BRAPC|nr:transposase HI [Brachionus plicatilis]